MSTILFKEVSYPLVKLIEDIELGEIGLPEIQRPFVWKDAKVRDLFDSMFKGFPVGYLLFWVNGTCDADRPIGTGLKQKFARLLIVDGQQRLTSLYAVMKGKSVLRKDYSKERIQIAFCPRSRAFEVLDAAIRRDPEYIPDVSEIWADNTTLKRFTDEFLDRLRQHVELSKDEEYDIADAIDRLHKLRDYPFTAMELSEKVDEEAVAEVFVRINSKGTPLNQTDFILTLMSVFWEEGRKELERFCQDALVPPTSRKPTPYNHYIDPDPGQMLRVSVALGFRRSRMQHVYSVLRGKDMVSGEYSVELRKQQFEVLGHAQMYALDLQNWHEFLKVLLRAGFRGWEMITSEVGLLNAYALFLIGKRDYGVEPYQLREVVARWFFMTSITGHYSGSPETVMGEDLGRLESVKNAEEFCTRLNRIVKDTLTDDYWNITLPNALGTSAARSPSLFAYHAALVLLEARALFSKVSVSAFLDPATQAKKSAVERHHLFPKNYLKSLGITSKKEVNQIANYALVEWSDNIKVGDKPPSEYFPKCAARFAATELERMMYWHALPGDWENMEYSDFLEARRKLIAQVIHDGYTCLMEHE